MIIHLSHLQQFITNWDLKAEQLWANDALESGELNREAQLCVINYLRLSKFQIRKEIRKCKAWKGYLIVSAI